MAIVSQRNIADALGYSIAAVSMALRDDASIPPATRARIKKKAQQMGYTPNPLFSMLMSNLHKHQYHETMVYLTAWGSADYWRRYHAHQEVFDSAVDRAQKCGFGLDHFWLGSVDGNLQRLYEVLDSRGIRSVVLPYSPCATLRQIDWSRFVAVTVGWTLDSPRLSSAETDYHDAMDQAIEGLERLGHRKIGLALNSEANIISSFRFAGRYLARDCGLISQWKCPPFFPADGEWNQQNFTDWLLRERPSAVICQAEEVPAWVAESGLIVPRDLSLVHLDWSPAMAEWAGVNQNNRVVGTSAIDLMAGQLFQNMLGVPVHPQSVLVKSSWANGPSAIPQKPAHEATRSPLARRGKTPELAKS